MDKILLIDRDPGVREVLDFLGNAYDLEVDRALTENSAVQSFAGNKVDFICIDVELPNLNIRSLINQMTRISERLGKSIPPLFFLYTNQHNERFKEARKIPRSGFLPKPLNIVDTYKSLRPWLETRQTVIGGSVIDQRKDAHLEYYKKINTWLSNLVK